MPSTPLFAPRRFFAQRTPSLIGAAVILYLTGIVAVTSGAPFVVRRAGLVAGPVITIPLLYSVSQIL